MSLSATGLGRLSILALLALADAMRPPPAAVRRRAASPLCRVPVGSFSRRGLLGTAAVTAALGGFSAAAAAETALPPGLKYTVLKSGTGGGSPVVGDLIAIRFKATVRSTGTVIDNILDSAEPYYYRAGSGQVVPAVEAAVLRMRSGDVWALEVPPELGFGSQGRASSPGKPRISGDAVLDFVLELSAVPGKDEELIDQIGLFSQ